VLAVEKQPYKHWPKIFNNDSTLTSTVLHRLLHQAETVMLLPKIAKKSSLTHSV
jgi:hypothetical protein